VEVRLKPEAEKTRQSSTIIARSDPEVTSLAKKEGEKKTVLRMQESEHP
jgi:hypothetical protein